MKWELSDLKFLHKLRISPDDLCPVCDGTGRTEEYKTCPMCGGRRVVADVPVKVERAKE